MAEDHEARQRPSPGAEDDRTYNPVWLAERTQWSQAQGVQFPLSGAQGSSSNYHHGRRLQRNRLSAVSVLHCEAETKGCQYEYLLPPININIKSISDAYAGQVDGHGVPSYEIKAPVTIKETVFLTMEDTDI
ncbi:MAG: hypothetical protein Q9212_003294 [Teloschistes hypoglaucus]